MTIELCFAKVLRTVRITKCLSQEELALRSELDRTYISMLEQALNMMPSELVRLVELERLRSLPGELGRLSGRSDGSDESNET